MSLNQTWSSSPSIPYYLVPFHLRMMGSLRFAAVDDAAAAADASEAGMVVTS